MSSKLLINVNDATPAVVPDTDADTNPDTNVPDTGVFSTVHNDGVNNTSNIIAPIIGVSVLLVLLLALMISLVKKHKSKKTNKFSIYSKGHTILRITGIMTLILITTFVALNYNVKQEDNVSAASDTLTVTTSDIEIDVDLNDTAVFATGESTVTVDTATTAGYTLMAYVDSATTDLTNETNKSSTSTISMLGTTDFKNPTSLTDNTWGMATTKPTDQTSAVFTGLPATLDEAITLKTTDEATEANDKSTFYYGTYITPELDYGTYEGATITYIAIANYAGPCNPNATTIQEAVCMQDFAGPNSKRIIDSMTLDTQYTLVDARDEKPYYISKLADGNVWMTQNLDHDIVTTTDFYTYANTDIGHGTTPNTSAKWTAERATYATSNTNWYDVDDSYSNPESYDPGNLCWNGTFALDYSGTLSTYAEACGSDKHYHIGNYYNWTAAVAMNDSSSYTTYFTDVDQSICPAGWRLPTYSGNKSYDNLVTALSLTSGTSGNVQSAPVYFVYGGAWNGESDDVGGGGYYWSSVVSDGSGAYEIDFYMGGNINPQNSDFRDYGNSVRCVARTGDSRPDEVILDISNLTYMQEFATLTSSEKSRVLVSMVEGQQYQLKDNRDEKTYYVSKLADGNVWMTQNLDHDIVTTTDFYTYANTDIGHGAIPNTNATWTAETATHATNDTTWIDTTDSPESYNPGDLCWNGTIRSDDNGTISTDTVSCGNDKHYHIGNYYNWTAAVAMNDSSSYTTDEQDVDQSICPAGWRLPTYSGDKSYDNLVTELGLTSGTSGNVQNTPTYFVYGGYWYGSSSYVGYGGRYWSSVVNGGSYAYKFYFYRDGRMYPRDSGGRNLGSSVRCVAR